MPTQLKNFIKVGMRNPYFIDVKMESSDIFAKATGTKGYLEDYKNTISITEFETAMKDEELF
eukprot:CAMPEP_0116874276 /NCGR_PEP_ID=MMETSP0463-20121206/5707_1 /TAXON_ID=181622 /ORGANISM="Strombidinopsis sp, Strain SopsisLIS2011" /LENGTH=61 /DNA_ID=CAMNT_0004517697 /DNA_START=566 /DNA_END=751 /DNA_ORIENTATION=+